MPPQTIAVVVVENEGCCNLNTAKTWLFGFILVLWIIGSILISAGVVTMLDSQKMFKHANALTKIGDDFTDVATATTVLNALIAMLIILGTIVMIIGFLGCFAIAIESQKMLCFFFCTLFIVMTGLLSMSTVLLIHQNKIRNTLERIMRFEVDNGIPNGFLAFAHEELDCCGIKKMSRCRIDFPPYDKCVQGSTRCSYPCLDAVWYRIILPKIRVFLGVAIFSCVVMATVMTNAMVIFVKIGNSYVGMMS